MPENDSAIYLVACVSKKRTVRTAARNLYVSTWFSKARQYIDAQRHPWFILSAQYGLIGPNQVIAPYERTLNTMRMSDCRIWAQQVDRQLAIIVPDVSRVVFLAGNRYRMFLAQHLADRGIAVTVPMQGLGIGKQLRWMNQQLLGSSRTPRRA